MSDPDWRPSRTAEPTTWEAIAAHWPDHDIRGAWDALTAGPGDYRPTMRPEWPFEPVLHCDGDRVYASMPDPTDEWSCPPYWVHTPGSDHWTHPIPMTRRLGSWAAVEYRYRPEDR